MSSELQTLITNFQDFRNRWNHTFISRDELIRTEKAQHKSKPFDKGRDPKKITTVLSKIFAERGWLQQIACYEIVHNWETLMGVQVAKHLKIVDIRGQELVLQADTQAWMLEFSRGRSKRDTLTKINTHYPAAQITNLVVLRPGGVQQNFGRLRTRDGRGHRDTYDLR